MLNHGLAKFFLASILSYFLMFILMPQLKKQFLDIPNQRSSHKNAVPRGGGLAFVCVGTILSLIFCNGWARWIPLICVPLAMVGLTDDYRGIPAGIRYIVQLITATALVCIGTEQHTVWMKVVFVITITAVINFTNFMDGLDGLLAGCAVLLMAATTSWVIAGSIFGFLLWNWSPAKVFMGDVGSTFIGAVFAGMALQSHDLHDVVITLLIGFPLFADASICIVRRLIRGDNIFTAHRLHLYQRLNQAGWKHSYVASVYFLSTMLLLAIRSIDNIPLLLLTICMELTTGVYLDQRIAVKFGKN